MMTDSKIKSNYKNKPDLIIWWFAKWIFVAVISKKLSKTNVFGFAFEKISILQIPMYQIDVSFNVLLFSYEESLLAVCGTVYDDGGYELSTTDLFLDRISVDWGDTCRNALQIYTTDKIDNTNKMRHAHSISGGGNEKKNKDLKTLFERETRTKRKGMNNWDLSLLECVK